jgi:hypothetical protein
MLPQRRSQRQALHSPTGITLHNARSTYESSVRTSLKSLFYILVAIVLFAGFYWFLFQQVHLNLPEFGSQGDRFSLMKQADRVHGSIRSREIDQIKTINDVFNKKVVVGEEKRKRYAYAITITKDGFFQDGAAVLVYSIMKNSWNASYDISFVAFVHPNVTVARVGLEKLGFHIIEVPIPMNRTAIKFDFLREKIEKNGCCGSSEMIKITSYRYLCYLNFFFFSCSNFRCCIL